MEKDSTSTPEKIIQFNESAIQGHLSEMVRHSVEATLNQMLEAEADRLCHAEKYQRSEAREDTRAGFYQRKLHTKAGEVTLNMPKLRRQTFETAIIERYRRREASVEEALIEMYLAGVSVRRVEDITEALWGTKVSPGTISKLNQKVYKSIEAWRNQPIDEPFPYVYLDGVVLKRSWAGEVSNVSVLVAIGVNESGYRKILGVAEGAKEDKAGWSSFLRHLKERGLAGVRLFTTDACLGLVESLAEFFPEARWQRCTVHFYRNVFCHVPRSRMPVVADMLKAIHAAEDLQAATGQGSGGRREADNDAAGQCGQDAAGRRGPDAGLLPLPAGASSPDQDQQRPGAHYPRDPPAHPSGGRLPGWPVGLDAVCSPAPAHCRQQVGPEALPQHGPAQRSGTRTANGGLSLITEGHCQEKSERLFTLPRRGFRSQSGSSPAS